MKRAIVTYASGAHEELLDVSLPGYKDFAARHGYDIFVGSVDWSKSYREMPPAWTKIPILLGMLQNYEEVVWFDCDLVVVNPTDDFPAWEDGKMHSMVRHFEESSEVPNSGVWRLRRTIVETHENDGCPSVVELLGRMKDLEVFTHHGWWEQAALLTLMGYSVPPQDSHFPDTKCRCVFQTKWYKMCQFMRLCWNSHPQYRSSDPRVVHCSYPDMAQRLEVMRALVKDPHYTYPRFEKPEKEDAPQ